MNTLKISLPEGVTAPDKVFGLGETFFHMVDSRIGSSEVSHIIIVRNASGMFMKYSYTSDGLEQRVDVKDMFHTKEDLARDLLGLELAPVPDTGMSQSEKDARVFASGAFLTETLPTDWYDMSEEGVEEFISDHAWVQVEDMPVGDIWELIDDHAIAFLNRVEAGAKK